MYGKLERAAETILPKANVKRNQLLSFLELRVSGFVTTRGHKCERLPLRFDLTVVGVIGMSVSNFAR